MCFWPQAIGSVVHLFEAVCVGRTAADAQKHNSSYADVKNFRRPKHVGGFFLGIMRQTSADRD